MIISGHALEKTKERIRGWRSDTHLIPNRFKFFGRINPNKFRKPWIRFRRAQCINLVILLGKRLKSAAENDSMKTTGWNFLVLSAPLKTSESQPSTSILIALIKESLKSANCII